MLMQRQTSKLESSMSFAHRANIERYKKLLNTRLTDTERAFVLLRLEEERRALDQLSKSD